MAGRQTAPTDPFGTPPAPTTQSSGTPSHVTIAPIGVPYVVDASGNIVPYAASVAGTEAETQTKRAGVESTQRAVNYQVPARYFTGDQLAPASWPPGQIAAYQQQLVAAGLLKRGSYHNGVWDPASTAAYEQLLGAANAAGLDKDEMLARYTSSFAADPNRGKAPLVTQPTNPDDLRQVFRKAIIDTRGEGWTQDKIDRMVSAYQAEEIAAQTAQYNASDTGGTVTPPPSPQAYAEAQVRSEDPAGAQGHDAVGYANEFFAALKGVA